VRIDVDRDQCEANGLCVNVAPDYFELDDDDELLVKQPEDAEADRARIVQAVASCPKVALTLRD
jgi:ferredoxin